MTRSGIFTIMVNLYKPLLNLYMGITIRTNTPFAAVMKSAIPGATYVYVKPKVSTPQQASSAPSDVAVVASRNVSSFTSPTESASKPNPVYDMTKQQTVLSNIEKSVASLLKWQKDNLSDTKLDELSQTSQDDVPADMTGGGGAGGGSTFDIMEFLGLSGLQGEDDTKFMESLKSILGNIPAVSDSGGDTFISDFSSLFSGIPPVPSTSTNQGDTFVSDMFAQMPEIPSRQFSGDDGLLSMFEQMNMMLPALDVLSSPNQNDFYDYFYAYKNESFINDYLYYQ